MAMSNSCLLKVLCCRSWVPQTYSPENSCSQLLWYHLRYGTIDHSSVVNHRKQCSLGNHVPRCPRCDSQSPDIVCSALISHELDQCNDWISSNTKEYCIIGVMFNRLMNKTRPNHTKYTDTGQPTKPKSFAIVVERTAKSNRDSTTAYSDSHETVGKYKNRDKLAGVK